MAHLTMERTQGVHYSGVTSQMKFALAASAILLATSALASPTHQRQITPPVYVAPFSAQEAVADASKAPTVRRFTFNIPSGGTSSLIGIPANRPVKLMVAQITEGTRAVGEATLLAPSPASFVEWVGYDYATEAFTNGFTSTAGTHIIWADFSEDVDVQVGDANHIQVHNNNSGAQKVILTLIF
jgi:hypothetical protein